MWYDRKYIADKAFLQKTNKTVNSIQPLDLTSLLKTQELEKQIKWHYTEAIQQIQDFSRRVIDPGDHRASYSSLPDFFLQLHSILLQERIYSFMACSPPPEISALRAGILVSFCFSA